MKSMYILPLDDPQATLEVVGGKGSSLAKLVNAGFPVPDGYHITTNAYRRFVSQNELQPFISQVLETVDPTNPSTLEEASTAIAEKFCAATIPGEVTRALMKAYSRLPGINPPVAVRSSATAEDLPEASFAGQQETYLNIRDDLQLLDAVRKCWASLWTARAIGYRSELGIQPDKVALAVIVQVLVDAESAGIMFTANPLNGQRNQILISASWGLGEAVVGGRVTADTLTVDKSSGQVISRETGEKLIQTVSTQNGTADVSIPAPLQKAPVLSDERASELARLGQQIEETYQMHMDIEWALAGDQFAILQARPITALPAPEPPAPTEWKLPDGAYSAMRNNIVELMTDPLTPFFRTFGLHAVNTSMHNLLSSFFGNTKIMPDDLIISVNEYAYYNGSVRFGPMMKIIFSTRQILKRMFTGAVERWTEEGRPEYLRTVQDWRTREWKELPARHLLKAARQLTMAAIDAYGSLVSGVIPAAWISEALFTFIYKFLKRQDDPAAPTYLMGFDSLPIRAEKELFDLSQWAKENIGLSAYLSDTPSLEIVSHLENGFPGTAFDRDVWHEWQNRFEVYLNNFGHTIYNLDFSNPVPADDPTPIIEALKLFISGKGTNPYTRQAKAVKRREVAVASMRSRLKGRRLALFNKYLERAQRYAPLREDGIADVGLSYPLLRQMLRELGRRFVSAGMIEIADDIFWLQEDEVEEAIKRLDMGETLGDLTDRIPQRKATWNAAKRVSPPMMLPQIKVLGFDLMKLKSGRDRKRSEDILKGVAASPGSVTAPACVMHGPGDFNKMKTGDVLVASLTTPAWTPLFTRASAVVTDIGGPLSHGSIVAREYGIPAVLGTKAATTSIIDGQLITVDGSAGIVHLAVDRENED